MSEPTANVMEQIVSLAKRRAFIYQASEIYGGIRGFWDYGPLGVLLKNNIRDWWWRNMVECPPVGPDGHPVEIVGLDSAIIQHPRTWEASGHVAGFNDPMVDCKACQSRFRADHLMVYRARRDDQSAPFYFSGFGTKDDVIQANAKKIRKLLDVSEHGYTVVFDSYLELNRESQLQVPCPDCDQRGTLMEPRAFNLMLDTYPGPIRDEENKAYLRPETAQGIFLNYKNIIDTTRVKMPFGVAQIGKSFRNEVTPRNFIFRSREFEQMEMEWFCAPDDSLKWYEFWKQERMKWWESLGVSKENLRFRDHDSDELAHYSKACVDIEYKYPFTAPDFGELEGVAHRGCFDLTQHAEHSKQRLDYFDQELQLKLKAEGKPDDEVKSRSRYVPNVIEPASGLTRAVLVLLCEAYTPDATRPSGVYLKFKPQFAPVKLGIFPLVAKEGMPEIAEKLYLDLRRNFTCEFDEKQSIGKRYARMDEIGTPFCVTIDGDTLKDQTVTVRHRDTQQQERIAIDNVRKFLAEKLAE